MSIKRVAAAIGAAALLLLQPTAAQAAPNRQDTAFLQAAHQSNLAEIAGGRIAQEKGVSQDVKDLGARFVEDHTKLDAAVQQAAEALGVDLPERPNSKQRAIAERYEATSGEAFDSLFISTQMESHMAAMSAGRAEIARGSDAQAKKVAQDAAPVIASHHEALDEAARELGIPGMIGTGTGGQAESSTLTAPVVGLVGGGLVLTVMAVFLLRRRTPARR